MRRDFVIICATYLDCLLKVTLSSSVRELRYLVSRRERLDFCFLISSVINGLLLLDGQVTVLNGACLSRMDERVEVNWCK